MYDTLNNPEPQRGGMAGKAKMCSDDEPCAAVSLRSDSDAAHEPNLAKSNYRNDSI